jgi:ribosome-associated protein
VHAAESKQARDLVVLDVREVTSFADFFLIATGLNTRQIQAIADEIRQQLAKQGESPVSVEGYENAEWVLVDYGDFLVHIFSQKAREYYDLERLWRDAKQLKW